MKLIEWLSIPNADGTRKRRRDFAAKIGVTPTMVTEYAAGRVWPGRDKMVAIYRETDRQVAPNDFLQLEGAVQ